MKKFLISAVFVFIGSLVFSQEKVAVFPFEDMDNVLTRNEAALFYRQFNNEFTNRNSGAFTVVPRQDVERLINIEASFQLSDFSARTKTAEMQRVLNGTRILSGLIGRVGNNIHITVSLYTYPDLQQLPGGADLTVPNKTELFNKIPELVQKMQSVGQTVYKIGDIGPAGGIVFYDKGFYLDSWRYLEVAPAEIEFEAKLGGVISNTMTGIGYGKQNTQRMADWLSVRAMDFDISESNYAVQICRSISFNGYNDWFIPSKDELDLMFKNLSNISSSFFHAGPYWSSSHTDGGSAWEYYFEDDGVGYSQDGSMNFSTKFVRAIRQF